MQNHSLLPQYIVRPQRHRGRLISHLRRGGNYQGDLLVYEVKDNELNRHVRYAELRLQDVPLIPVLIDPQILRMTPALLVLAGWERLTDDRGGTQGYQQTWWCTPTFEPAPPLIKTPQALNVRGERVR